VTCAPVVAVRQYALLLLGRQREERAVLCKHPLDELLVHAVVHSCTHKHTNTVNHLCWPFYNKAWHELLVYDMFQNCPHPPTHTHTDTHPVIRLCWPSHNKAWHTLQARA